MRTFVLLLFGFIALLAEEIKKPTSEELAEAAKFYGRTIKIPKELYGIWTAKANISYTESFGTYTDTLNFCSDLFIENEYKETKGNKEKSTKSYDVITSYSLSPRQGQGVYFFTLQPVKREERGKTIYGMFFYKNTKKLFHKSMIGDQEAESIEYKFEKCPSDKK